jgi:DnaJ-domain-containing protein 1
MVSVTVELPDNIARLLGEKEGLTRSVLEAAAADGYRTEKLTRFQVGELLGLDRWQTEEFLARHEAQRPFTLTDYEFERSSELQRR